MEASACFNSVLLTSYRCKPIWFQGHGAPFWLLLGPLHRFSGRGHMQRQHSVSYDNSLSGGNSKMVLSYDRASHIVWVQEGITPTWLPILACCILNKLGFLEDTHVHFGWCHPWTQIRESFWSSEAENQLLGYNCLLEVPACGIWPILPLPDFLTHSFSYNFFRLCSNLLLIWLIWVSSWKSD